MSLGNRRNAFPVAPCLLLVWLLISLVLFSCGGCRREVAIVGPKPDVGPGPGAPPGGGTPPAGPPAGPTPGTPPVGGGQAGPGPPDTEVTVPAGRTEIWRVWPGPPERAWSGDSFFAAGYAMPPGARPEFLFLSPVALGSDSSAGLVATLDAGRTRVIARLEDISECRLAPDRTRLVALVGESFLALTFDGGRSTLREGEGIRGADLLPDDRGLALLRVDAGGGRLSLVVASAAGERVVAQGVVDAPESEIVDRPNVSCRVSPDGSRVAFCGTRGESSGLFVVALETGAVTLIPVPRPWGVAWSPDGAYVAVPGSGVYTAAADGGQQIVALGSACGASVRWSDDGSQLLTAEELIAIPQGTRSSLAALGLVVGEGARVLPLGWVAGPAGAPGEAYVAVSQPSSPQ